MSSFDSLQASVRSKRLGRRRVTDIVAQLADTEVADFLAYLADHVSAATLGELLDKPETKRVFSEGIARSTQKRVFDGLEAWMRAPKKHAFRWNVHTHQQKEVAPKTPPRTRAQAKEFVDEHELHDILDHPATAAAALADRHVQWHLKHHFHGTVGDLIRGADVGYRAVEDAAQKAAFLYLSWGERRKRLALRRTKTWESRPDDANLQLLSHRLKEGLRTLENHTRPVRPSGPLLVSTETAGTSVEFSTSVHGKEDVAVAFAGFEHLPLRLDNTNAAELRVVLEWTLDAIHEKASPLRPALAELLSEPSWTRLLADLEEGLRSERRKGAKKPTERIVFRVEPLDGDSGISRVEVSAAIQKRGKNGQWSVGSVRPARKLLEHAAVVRDDVPVLDLLALAEQPKVDRYEVFATAAAALRGHSRVFYGRSKSRLSVVGSPPVVALEPADGGHRLGVRIGDFDLTNYSGQTQLVAIEGEELMHVADISPKVAGVIRSLQTHQAILPEAAQSRVLRLLPSLQPEAELIIPTGLRGQEQDAERTLVARLTPEEDGLELHIQARPLTEGPSWTPGEGPRMVFGVAGGERVYAHRDLDGERTCMRAMLDSIGVAELARQRIEGIDRALDVLNALQEQEDVVIEWPEGQRAWRVNQTGDLRVRVLRAGEWFGVEGGVEAGGKDVPLVALLKAVRAGQRYVRVAKGNFAKIEESLRKKLTDVSDVLAVEGDSVQVGVGSIEAIDALGVVDADDAWREILTRARAATTLTPDLPSGLQGTLRDYQLEGFQWLARLASWGAGACLADEMGLGKTIQTLAILLHRMDEGPALVVAPTSVGQGWISEAAKFAPELNVQFYRGTKRKQMLENAGPRTLFVTSYDVLARDGDDLSNIEFGTVVFDEAQAIKNARTRRAKSSRAINAKWRLALSGTPLENHLGELWSLFRTVSPGLLGPWEHFRRHYALPIERDGDDEIRAKLVGRLRPFLLRRTKIEVASELPPRTEVVLPVELGEKERRLYDATREEAASNLGSPESFSVLAAITRLRRLACHPRLVLPTWTGSSAKLDRFMELAERLVKEGRRALVFSQFTSHLGLVREALDFRRITTLYLDGKTPAKKRAALINEWQDGNDPMFLISLKAGGTGLNLTAADTVIHLDPWWNPAVEDQASDRAHRIGQDKPVTVIRLVAQNTIEEKVLTLHTAKRDLANALLSGGDVAGKMSVEDLVGLLDS